MQPPISPGIVLQTRYRILQILGHGGFGRTYLAEDLGRFNEPCAIKEFEPQQGSDQFSEKAMQLFQREAEILYQIQHPQIPQFRATFEQDQRLFMVQDYVDGTTYRDLLNQRLSQNMSFSEAEVRQFIQQLLPVLAHIHGKGIIHRDISPDNIIQRRLDHLPVLIDFGVVKEVVTRVQMPTATAHATSVGKLGYAPSEQIQSGRAYPSSDLYSLAVTAIVLLTGREPQDLFDDVNLTWNWQPYATVSPGFAQVLNKAVSYRPGDRYQSVSEMAQALGASPQGLGQPGMSRQSSPPSQVRTVAVGRQYQPTQYQPPQPIGASPSRSSPTTIQPEEPLSIWENPLAVTAIGLGLALLAGFGGWGLVQMLNGSGSNQTTTESPPPVTMNPDLSSPSPSPTPTPTATPTQQPVEYNQRLRLGAGDSRTISGNLQTNETINYTLRAESGQVLKAQLNGEGVLMTVLTPSGQAADAKAQRVLGWQGTLQESGDYVIQLRPVQGLAESDYALTVSLADQAPEPTPTPEPTTPEPTPEPTSIPEVVPTPNPQPTPEPTPEPTPSPEVLEQRVQIPSGQTSVQVTGQVGPERIRRYVVNAQQGQTMRIDLPHVTGPVTLDVRFPGGEQIPGAARVLSWQGQLPVGGDYMIDVKCSRPAEYTVSISVN